MFAKCFVITELIIYSRRKTERHFSDFLKIKKSLYCQRIPSIWYDILFIHVFRTMMHNFNVLFKQLGLKINEHGYEKNHMPKTHVVNDSIEFNLFSKMTQYTYKSYKSVSHLKEAFWIKNKLIFIIKTIKYYADTQKIPVKQTII